MNIIFFGSDNFAAAHLKPLISSDHHVVACVTQPDRPKGRGMNVAVSPVKEWAQANKIPVLQPASLKGEEFVKQLKEYSPDIFVVIAYGRFLPAAVLTVPPKGAINVHASLLPHYRGAAPINWAIVNGEKQTGLTVMYINDRMDAGDILAQASVAISNEDTSLSLKETMIAKGPDLLLKTLDDLAKGKAKPKAQDESKVTLAPKLTKELGAVQWHKSAKDIHNMVRGLQPWPNAFTPYNGKSLTIKETRVVKQDCAGQLPGTVLDAGKKGILVATGDQALLITRVHWQDAKPMDASAFVLGHELEKGYQFK